MKSLTLFLQVVLEDLGDWCYTSTTKDYEYILSRVEHEGYSFLTITLTDFGKDFEKSLDQGFVGPSSFVGFRRRKKLPSFLGGFLDQVFDRDSGLLLRVPSVECIRAVRQICLMFGKILLPCSEERIENARTAYLECEQDVKGWDTRADSLDWNQFDRINTLLWADIFTYVDQQVYEGNIKPQHGPGATADRLTGNSKWEQSEWTRRLDRVFPIGEYLLPNWRYVEYLDRLSILEPGEERPVRVIPVPKTLKTPRIIAIEPTAMQYMQQGLLQCILDAFGHRRKDFKSVRLAEQMVGWKSSVPNQRLACWGSKFGSLATLDLKDASDRVSNQHVRRMLRRFPHFGEAVDACRSRKAELFGSGEIVRLSKFASMGSALTFPFEAMMFLNVIFMGIENALSRPITREDIHDLSSTVRVFGDDIIVPKDFVNAVVESLESFNFKVNRNKSFWNGKFRESCGKEYYDGEDVTIVRVRRDLPSNRTAHAEIISTVSLRNQLYRAGLWRSVRYLDNLLEGLIPFPMVAETSPVLGRVSALGYETQRIHPHYQAPLVRGLVVVDKPRPSRLDDYPALHKVLISSGALPNPDIRHLLFAGRPLSVSTKQRWASPF
jgi:hypothetical protein